MALFAYEARSADGGMVRGTAAALDEQELDRILAGRDLFLLRARLSRPRSRRRELTRARIDFCYHLATVLEAGIPLMQALHDLQEDGRSPIAHELDDVARQVESGRSLSQAMSSHPRLFPELVQCLVAAGEESGNLDAILRRLVEHLEWREDLRRQVRAAAAYPCIVLAALAGLLTLLWTVVLPRFLTIFVELGVELPLATRALLKTQTLVAAHGATALVVGAASGLALAAAVRTEAGRYRLDWLVLHVPVVGRVASMIEMSRFSHNLGLLYRAGLPLLRCLELVERIVQNRVVREVVVRARESVRRGEPLTQAIAHGGWMPPMVVRMVSLGETSGEIDGALEHVASFYDREVPVVVDGALALVNTGAVVALGCTLGTVALAIFVPLYRMMGNLNA